MADFDELKNKAEAPPGGEGWRRHRQQSLKDDGKADQVKSTPGQAQEAKDAIRQGQRDRRLRRTDGGLVFFIPLRQDDPVWGRPYQPLFLVLRHHRRETKLHGRAVLSEGSRSAQQLPIDTALILTPRRWS